MSYRDLLAVCILIVVLPGCGAPAPPPGTPPVVSAPTSSAPGWEVMVRGTVERGVEPNCLVLQTADRDYLLVHPPPALQPGVTAVVRGRIEPSMVTTCMQGTPLVVVDARVG